ncbi:MAG: aminopeptidase [Treponema sp.]|nr:aminopeptidase [Treponema sp.]
MKSLASWFCSNLPVLIAALFLAGAAILCSGCYTLKQGTTMLGYLNRAVPLEELAGDGTASEEDRQFVQRVEDIRRFATEDLGLKESKNYTRYVELHRDYLAAVVSASAKDSFTRYEWWFPVVGKVPYKGFFNVDDAKKERTKLEKKDLDVWIRGVDAFSTLGWFRDPLYSYMKKYSDRELAELIIHELLHATVFLKNQTQFNEELAEFVGTEGARLYMEKMRAAKAEAAGTEAAGTPGKEDDSGSVARADSAAYVAFIRGLTAELDAMYKSDIPRDEKLNRKEEIINAAKARFDADYNSLFKTENYRGFSKLPVNNAYLELYTLYYEGDHFFKDLYARSGSDLPKFIAAAKGLKAKGDPKVQLEQALMGR